MATAKRTPFDRAARPAAIEINWAERHLEQAYGESAAGWPDEEVSDYWALITEWADASGHSR